MTVEKEPKKTWLHKFIEFLLSIHYYVAALVVLGAGVEYFYKGADKDGLIALVVLVFAVGIEILVLNTNDIKHKNELKQITEELNRIQSELDSKTDVFRKENTKLNEQIQELLTKNKNLLIIKHLNAAFNDIRNYEREDAKKGDESTFISAFTNFCNTLNTAFSSITGKEYHVCIKLIIEGGNSEAKNLNKLKKCKVKTFIREGKSLSTRLSYDKNKAPFLVKDNMDFNQIVDTWNTKQKPFVCNDLIALKEYYNSRFIDFYGTPKNEYNKASYEEREANWPLPYKSCITAAIGYAGKNHKGEAVGTIFGFLCIDCVEKNAFDEEIHPLILSGCAEGLYNTLHTFLTRYSTEPHVNKKPQQSGQR